MRVPVVNLVCACSVCGHEFRTVALSDFLYGTLLGHSESGTYLALMDTFSDPVFEEVDKILQRVCSKLAVPDFDLQAVLGFVCDVAPDASRYAFNVSLPICPSCHSTKTQAGEDVALGRASADLPNVTHNEWSRLALDERENLIEALVRTSRTSFGDETGHKDHGAGL